MRPILARLIAIGLLLLHPLELQSAPRSAGNLLQLIPGIYPFPANGQPQDVAAVEATFGRAIARTIQFISYGDWASFDSSATLPIAGRPTHWAVPLTVTGTPLSAVAAGAGDVHFLALAQNLIANTPGTGPIPVRFGWEFSGYDFSQAAGFFPWYAIGPNAPVNGAANYVASFRRAVTIFRGVSNRFLFDWCIQAAQGDGAGGYVDPTPAYPGRAYVDIASADVYFDINFDNPDPQTAFNFRVHNAGFGVDWIAQFARAQGLLLSIDEWGINTDAYAPIIIMMAEWLRSNQAFAHNYWMSNANFSGNIFGGTMPNAQANFIRQFNT
jgi:hypothetical protein